MFELVRQLISDREREKKRVSREVIIRIRDDLDGSDAAETIEFSYRGTSYEIDLSAANVELFDKSVKQFVEVARDVAKQAPSVAGPPLSRSPIAGRAVKQQRREVRAWAAANGYEVAGTGMIAAAVYEAYQAANPWVELLPGTATKGWTQKPKAAAAVDRVTAQQADEDGLISAAALLSAHHDRESGHGAYSPSGKKLDKATRDKVRDYAIAHGIDQAVKGRVRSEAIDAYFAANPERN